MYSIRNKIQPTLKTLGQSHIETGPVQSQYDLIPKFTGFSGRFFNRQANWLAQFL